MNRLLLVITIWLLFSTFLTGQKTNLLPPEAYDYYPTLSEMYGFAIGNYQDKTIILGGRIRTDIPELYSKDFPNLEIILIDYGKKRASALTSGNLEGILGEQISSFGINYYQKGNTLFLIGGYGYSEEQDRFITFPYLTKIDLEKTTTAIEKGENPTSHFLQIFDERLSNFEGLLDYNGERFFLLEGKTAYTINPFEFDANYHEEQHLGEIRTFIIQDENLYPEITDYQRWYDLEAFLDYYQHLLPEKIERTIQTIIRLDIY